MSQLKGNKNLYSFAVSDIVAQNLRQMFEYGLIERGGYTVAKFSDPETSGFTTLKRTYDQRSTTGMVYEGMGPSWVWQSGVGIPAGYQQPFQVSGVYINQIFYPPSTSGSYPYGIDYQHGRILFKNPITGTPKIECQYVFNDVAMYLADNPETKNLLHDYKTKYNEASAVSPSGLSNRNKEDRLWMPAVFVSIQERQFMRGLQLGGGDIQNFSVFYEIFTEEPSLRNRLTDLINDQYQNTISLYDVNKAPFDFKYDGSLNPSGQIYPEQSKRENSAFFTHSRVISSRGISYPGLVDFYRGEVRQIMEVDRGVGTF